MEKKLFLIGGKDLEMEEIVKILKKKNIEYVDRHLSWGASWKDYKDITDNIPQETVIYGIELADEIPQGCKLIDHHNHNNGKPASIIQLCNILGIEPSRHIQLVAANDSGYILSLLKMGATPDEIQKIRKKDRELSGCTKLDEENSKVKYYTIRKNGLTFIIAKCKTNKFAPFIDTHYSPDYTYVLWGEGEAQISGKNASKYIDLFKNYTPNPWYGGGTDGYVGGYLNEKDFDTLTSSLE